jgi:hypothetical protein
MTAPCLGSVSQFRQNATAICFHRGWTERPRVATGFKCWRRRAEDVAVSCLHSDRVEAGSLPDRMPGRHGHDRMLCAPQRREAAAPDRAHGSRCGPTAHIGGDGVQPSLAAPSGPTQGRVRFQRWVCSGVRVRERHGDGRGCSISPIARGRRHSTPRPRERHDCTPVFGDGLKRTHHGHLPLKAAELR